MEIKLSENIKRFRKERKMTQEQLAEALGVTTGAVYKWERNLSTPEIGLILQMADLFDTSTDVLLGFAWRNGNVDAAVARIRAFAQTQSCDDAAVEAEKALKKYPNHFDLVYQSGLLYLAQGEKAQHRSGRLRAYGRAIELLGHACELLPQCTDDSISEASIRAQIAKAHLMLGNTGEALGILKKYNVCGVNNALIGMVLADYLHDSDQAEIYLGRAFGAFAEEINDIMVGYANVFFQRKDYDGAVDCFRWLRTVLRGIQPETELTWFDKYDCVILETIAEAYCFKGEFETARSYLKKAIEKALRYDSASPGEIGNMRFFDALHIAHQPNYDEYGKNAMDCLRRRIQPGDDGVPHMWELWNEVREEVLPNETV